MKVLICDDEPTIIEHISGFIKREYPDIEILKAGSSGQFNEIITNNDKIDLFFADIMLGDENGINLANAAVKKYPDIQIVFVSGNTDMAGMTIDIVDSAAFIRKPIDDFYIRYHIDAFLKKTKSGKDVFVFNSGKKSYSIDISKLVYIESKKNEVMLYLTDETVKARAKISDFEPFTSNKLVRCHQSFVVNISFVSSFDKKHINLITGVSIPVSYSRMQDTKEKLYMYKGGML